MTGRERLIELLEFAMDYSYVMRELKRTTTDANENPFIAMADFLIANGVTIAKDINVGDKSSPTITADTCVCCGAIIPEGQMVCPNCLVTTKKERDKQ
jgi:hypothetical protein